MGGLLVVLMMLVAVPVVLAARHYQRGLEGRSAVHFEGDKPDLAGYHWSWWWLPGWVCEFERDGRRWERRLWQRRNTPRSIAREPQRRASAVPDTLIGVLDQLGTFYSRQRVVLIWDGLSSHWSTKMRAYLDSQRAWLRAERLPAYAPELNPVECLWANLKDLELANLPTTTLAEVADAATQGIQRVCSARIWSPASSPTPASPSTHDPSTNPRKSIRGHSGMAVGCPAGSRPPVTVPGLADDDASSVVS